MSAYQRLHRLPDDSPSNAAAGQPASARSSPDDPMSRLHAGALLSIGCVWSALIGAGLRCRISLAVNLRSQLPVDYEDRDGLLWLPCSHGVVCFLFVPLWCGLIDLFKVSYRLCSATAGLLALISAVLSAALSDPGHLVLTDALMAGTASSIALASLVLLTDDHFPEGSRWRILATSCVQGNSLATFYLVAAFSRLLPSIGWRTSFYWLGGAQCALALAGAALFSRPPGRRWRRRGASAQSARDDESSVIDRLRDGRDWPTRLLSLSQEDFDSSRTILLWLLERFLAALISDGLFLYLLMRSGLLSLAASTFGAKLQQNNGTASADAAADAAAGLSTALVFSTASSVAFVAGGVFGMFLTGGRMLTVYMLGSLTVLCSLIGWLGVSREPITAQWPFSLACGVGVGAFSTFAFAASEEATGVPARFIFPFTRLANGVAMATMEAVRAGLTDSSGSAADRGDVLLALLLLLSMGQLSAQLLVRRRRRRGAPKQRLGKAVEASSLRAHGEDRAQLLLLRPTRRKKQSLTIELQQ